MTGLTIICNSCNTNLNDSNSDLIFDTGGTEIVVVIACKNCQMEHQLVGFSPEDLGLREVETS